MSLADYQDKFKRLVVNKAHGHLSPHKLCMLLAVLDLARAGALPRNQIRFEPPLLERYNRFFGTVRTGNDHSNPYFPFFHLAGPLRGGQSSFWHLKPLPGRETVVGALVSARSLADISSNIAYAELDPELFALVNNPEANDALADTIARHWLDRGLRELLQVAEMDRASSIYERQLRQGAPTASEPPPKYVRDPAFRRFVTEVYDYRCAATGLRILLPTGEAMVQAAHLHPFSMMGDDDPRNGIALTPDMHWAMDKGLISPGPDLKWHVSPGIDDRVPDLRFIVQLKGRPLLLPPQGRFFPKREALEWRLEQLRKT